MLVVDEGDEVRRLRCKTNDMREGERRGAERNVVQHRARADGKWQQQSTRRAQRHAIAEYDSPCLQSHVQETFIQPCLEKPCLEKVHSAVSRKGSFKVVQKGSFSHVQETFIQPCLEKKRFIQPCPENAHSTMSRKGPLNHVQKRFIQPCPENAHSTIS
eukprot:6204917-Pleurochrysis_carterae.AAC.6